MSCMTWQREREGRGRSAGTSFATCVPRGIPAGAAVLAAALLVAPVAAVARQTESPSDEALRRAAHGRALARIGQSGLRSLLAASGNLGDLRNRAGSYEMAVQLERARRGPLEGRVTALERALEDPSLPPGERAVLEGLRDATREKLANVPRYDAAYRTATAQTEALRPFGFLGERPLFLMVRARGHARWGGDDGLTVFSEAVSAGPVLVTDRWIVSPGLSLGRTDVTIGPFDGSSGTTSLAAHLSVGRLLGNDWSAAAQLVHGWSRGAATIHRPGPDGATEVRTEGRPRSLTAKAEVKGLFAVAGPGDRSFRIRPRVGAFTTSQLVGRSEAGDGGSSPFGERETVAALRVGASLETDVARWSPILYLGWEEELADDMRLLVDDPRAVLAMVGVSRSWGRGRRVSVDYGLLRGLDGLRRVSELTLVLILDG